MTCADHQRADAGVQPEAQLMAGGTAAVLRTPQGCLIARLGEQASTSSRTSVKGSRTVRVQMSCTRPLGKIKSFKRDSGYRDLTHHVMATILLNNLPILTWAEHFLNF